MTCVRKTIFHVKVSNQNKTFLRHFHRKRQKLDLSNSLINVKTKIRPYYKTCVGSGVGKLGNLEAGGPLAPKFCGPSGLPNSTGLGQWGMLYDVEATTSSGPTPTFKAGVKIKFLNNQFRSQSGQ